MEDKRKGNINKMEETDKKEKSTDCKGNERCKEVTFSEKIEVVNTDQTVNEATLIRESNLIDVNQETKESESNIHGCGGGDDRLKKDYQGVQHVKNFEQDTIDDQIYVDTVDNTNSYRDHDQQFDQVKGKHVNSDEVGNDEGTTSYQVMIQNIVNNERGENTMYIDSGNQCMDKKVQVKNVDDNDQGIKDVQKVQHTSNGKHVKQNDNIQVQNVGDADQGTKDYKGVQHIDNGNHVILNDKIQVQNVGVYQSTKRDQTQVQKRTKNVQVVMPTETLGNNDQDPGTRNNQVETIWSDGQNRCTIYENENNVKKCDQDIKSLQIDKQTNVEQKTKDSETIIKRIERQTKENDKDRDKFQSVIPTKLEGDKLESTKQKYITEHICKHLHNTKTSEEHMEKIVMERESIPQGLLKDNDSGHEGGVVYLEHDEHFEEHGGEDDEEGIEELQKLIEDHHLTKRDTQDLSEAELSNKDQEDHSDRPYYDKVPPISAETRPSHRLTTHRALIAQIPSPSIEWNSTERRLSTRQSARRPPAVVKMSTVMISSKKRRAAVIRSMSQYYEVKRHAKLLRWDECVNSRPPLPIDLDLPGPWHYSPTNKPLYETNAPEYSFGIRFYERGGGARTAHAKAWYNSNSSYTTKVNFEKRWPSPAQYNSKPLLGRRNYTLPDFPVYTIGVRSKFSINKKGSESEPSPNEYYPDKSNTLTLPCAPSYSFGARHSGTCTAIAKTDPNNPGPGNYTPRLKSIKPHRPAFTIKGIRVPKSHMLGPHSTL